MRSFVTLTLATALALTACVKTTTTDSSSFCTSNYECVNSVCTCDDGSSCDEATCEDDCEVCE
ncbi:MAG: hypothetical protein H6739_15075 [Alphaproteobacteria bacterium]|nr:hypothetical protein [Alphaproteobacteria bacterium]